MRDKRAFSKLSVTPNAPHAHEQHSVQTSRIALASVREQVVTAKVSWFEAKRKIRKGERRTSKLALRGNLKRGKVRSC